MSKLFERVVHPLATPETPGALLGGLRVMAVDGTVLDVPDSRANARVFGYPSSRPGTRAAFPKVRLVLRNCCWDAFNCGRPDVSLPDGRASSGAKTATLSQ
jgi:hypothetical protein